MKRTSGWTAAVIATGLLAVASSALSAEVNTSKGHKELLFGFSGLSDLGAGSFNGGIGMRHYINDRTALRPGIQFGWSKHNPDGDNNDTRITTGGANLAWERHHASQVTSVSPYCGLGAGVNFAQSKTTVGTTGDDKTTGMGFSAYGLAGFECGVADGVTLGGEYRLGFNWVKSKFEAAGSTTSVETTDTGLNLGSANGAMLYLGVHWK